MLYQRCQVHYQLTPRLSRPRRNIILIMSATIITPDDLAAMEKRILQALQQPEKPETTWLTIKEVAGIVKHSDRTVKRWLSEGKRDMNGNMRRLKHYKFTETDCRILLSDLIEFGQIK